MAEVSSAEQAMDKERTTEPLLVAEYAYSDAYAYTTIQLRQIMVARYSLVHLGLLQM